MSSKLVDRLSQRLYADAPTDAQILDSLIRTYLSAGQRILDLGCGSGRLFPYDYRGDHRQVVGVDVDPAVSRNGRVSSGARASAYHLPFRDEAFDIVYSRYVFEHLERPREAFGEIARVLRPGGITIILTPNKAHYVALISRFTPHWFHRFVNEKLRGRPAEETFPTVYRANTRRALNALARSAGLEPAQVRMVELRPNYLMWGVLPFLLGVAYERLVNSTAWLEDLRVNIVAAYRKPGSRGGQARPAVQARAVARGGGTSPS